MYQGHIRLYFRRLLGGVLLPGLFRGQGAAGAIPDFPVAAVLEILAAAMRARRRLPGAPVERHRRVNPESRASSASVSAAVLGLFDCLQPVRLPLTRHLDMWAIGDGAHSLPLNFLAAGLGLRHGLSPRCYHGTVLLCGTAPGPRRAGLSIDQVLAMLAQIADVAHGL